MANEKPGGFALRWVIASALSIVAAWFLMWIPIVAAKRLVGDWIVVGGQRHITEDWMAGVALLPLLTLSLGFAQWLLLRRRVPGAAAWILTYCAGWLAVAGLLAAAQRLGLLPGIETTTGSLMPLPAAFLLAALAQWLLLRRRLPGAHWWMAAAVLGWALALPLMVWGRGSPGSLLVALLIPAVTGGAVLQWLLAQAPPHPAAA